jgi:hypothetical protein
MAGVFINLDQMAGLIWCLDKAQQSAAEAAQSLRSTLHRFSLDASSVSQWVPEGAAIQAVDDLKKDCQDRLAIAQSLADSNPTFTQRTVRIEHDYTPPDSPPLWYDIPALMGEAVLSTPGTYSEEVLRAFGELVYRDKNGRYQPIPQARNAIARLWQNYRLHGNPNNWITKPGRNAGRYTPGTMKAHVSQARSLLRIGRVLGAVGTIVTLADMGFDAKDQWDQDSFDPTLNTAEKVTRAIGIAVADEGLGIAGGITIGALAGAIGSAVPGFGTVVGVVVGGVAGSIAGNSLASNTGIADKLKAWVNDWFI